jgi:O-antigen ligase
VVFSILYAVSFYKDSIFGFPLKYDIQFVPLAENLHQISMYLVPLPFIGIFLYTKTKGVLKKSTIIFLVALDIEMALSTGSSKVIISFVVASLFFFNMILLDKLSRKTIISIFVIELVLLFLLFILFETQIEHYIIIFFTKNDLSGARLSIYQNAFSVISNSFIIGHGPGPHVYHTEKFYDAHQTILTVLLQTGFFGLILYLLMLYKLIKSVFNNPYIFGALVTLIIYSLGGDILRRLPVWILFILLYYYTLEPRNNKIIS